MDVLSRKLTSVEEFLAWVPSQEGRYELVNGEIRMMTGATHQHNDVTNNVTVALTPLARRSGCRSTTNETGIRTGPNGIRYPDVSIDCGPRPSDGKIASNPTIIVEVSSPSTRGTDLGIKLWEYQGLPSVQVIVQIEPDVALVAVHRRKSDGSWQSEVYEDLEGSIQLPSLAGALTLKDIYFGLDVRPRPTLQLVNR